MDGQKQRNALTAVEKAIQAMAAGDRERALRNAAKAEQLDQIGIYTGLVDAMATEPPWPALRSLLPPGPLHGLIDAVVSPADG